MERNSWAWELDPAGRSYALREAFWRREPERYLIQERLEGCGEETLVGHARDFAAWLDASPPSIQPLDLLAGVALIRPAPGSSLNFGHYDGHYPPGHAKLMREGLAGIRDRARAKLAGETDPAKRDFLEAVVIAYEAAQRCVARHACHAEELAARETDAIRRAELQRMAAVCHQLTEGPPASFQAGLQLLWFTFMWGGRGCIGRFDQWMYPLYRRDLEAGKLTWEEAQELLENLWVKLNYFAGNNDSLRNIALAGQTPQGEDACNDLTYMALLATARLRLPEPKLNVRFFRGTPRSLLEFCCRVTQRGLSQPAYFNDEVALPALLQLGIPLEEARDYCNDGCSELIIGGKGTLQFHNFDTLPLLDEAVRRAQVQPYRSFQELMEDLKQRLLRFIPPHPRAKQAITHPYFAASIEDCLEEASPEGARYSIWGSIPAQMAHLADALSALKRFVFEERSLTWEELIAALNDNFEGHERLRQKLLHRAPKYGNDEEEVDLLLKELAESFCDELHARVANPPGPGGKGAAGFMAFGLQGRLGLPASPDGRRQGEPTANSFSPAPGRDHRGPTAVLKSVGRVDLRKASHGSVLDLAFHPSALRGENGLRQLMAFVETFLKMPCSATLQINTIDRETLLQARQDPTNPAYRTLLVRVWGFSAVFVELHPDLQQHVLERTEHTF